MKGIAKEKIGIMNEKLKNIVLPVIAYGGLAGILSGFLVGVFNFFARYLIEYSQKIYQSVLDHLWALPLFFIGLAALALLMAVLHRLVPNVRGSGIPNVEGAIRGLLTFKWLRTLVGTVIGCGTAARQRRSERSAQRDDGAGHHGDDEGKADLEKIRNGRRRGRGYSGCVQRAIGGNTVCYGRMSQEIFSDNSSLRVLSGYHGHNDVPIAGYGDKRSQMVEHVYAFQYRTVEAFRRL